ncbi:hypothetical protein NBRC110019_32540 [Neptunitalea chrysea]|uniref:Uncharacterized protein n=1 Tax=Neptunitalea chrysea TaxID=1647581 RepID=A0A9W6B8U9_9FLAO|nr:hypothetical protein [Neptunitalea chrysea]GLB54212.1 hypothetical protein NBRC110019_32540 [Neptunitalea chrysea]
MMPKHSPYINLLLEKGRVFTITSVRDEEEKRIDWHRKAILNYSTKFKAAISMNGLSNKINHTKYKGEGKYLIHEYENPNKPSMKKYLRSYSPLHNLKTLSNKRSECTSGNLTIEII